MWSQLKEASDFIAQRIDHKPEIGIVLGTGLGGLADKVNAEHVIEYSEIPHFPQSTVEGHDGKLIFGTINNRRVVLMKGRFHYYEGYSMQQVVFPIRVMYLLGATNLIVSNASGGVNANFEVGDIMLIQDQINLQPENPLRGPNLDQLGPRFPDMSEPYDLRLLSIAESIAVEKKILVHKGTYASVSGPNFETPAEYGYIARIGADAVGMSTVPEVMAARHMGMRCFGVSVITDLGVEGKIEVITHEEVQKVARKAEQLVSEIVLELIGRWE